MDRPGFFLTFSLFLFILALIGLAGCGSDRSMEKKDTLTITVWFHTGRPEEKQVMEDQVRRFNQSRTDMVVKLVLIPEGDYNTQVQAAAAAGALPDLLDLDGPFLANYAWKGHLRPLTGFLPPELKNDLLPSIITQGTYNKELYAVGIFDSGLGLYGSRAKLIQAGVRLPTGPDDAWTIDEFDHVLAALAGQDDDSMVLDLRLDYRGEWFTYAFSPLLVSAGGDLIDRRGYQSADRVLNGDGSVFAMTRVQNWFNKKYVDPNIDAAAFTSGRVALSWCGHWEYPRYHQALGDDLVLLPLPDFGHGSRTSMGSWCWAIPRNGQHPDKAAEFLQFLLSTPEVLAMCAANGAVPATRSAVAASPLYRPEGPLHLFVQQLEKSAVPRPRTPAYPMLTSAFQQLFQDIRHGGPVREALDRAVAIIDQDIVDNQGYQPQ
ncbi:MAG: sugar ABC transporter substrate-binding protein [Desulfobacterales bacterium]|nr:sugar ABC transporter substrate-binding protein [Desulfobacterales bacterium]